MDETLPIFVSFNKKTNTVTVDPNLVTVAFLGHSFSFNYSLTDTFNNSVSKTLQMKVVTSEGHTGHKDSDFMQLSATKK
jgi:hypothetical protein